MPACHAPDGRPRSAAIVTFMPDYGHAQPLLKIADALARAGFDIHVYLAAECAPLMGRFPFEATSLDPMDLTQAKEVLPKVFARGIFFNNFSGNVHFNMYTLPEVSKAASRSAERLRSALERQRPDVVIAEAFLYSEWYARMGEAVGAPVILNDLDGSLAGAQRRFVRAYGVTSLPAAAQGAVEAIGAAHAKLYNLAYRLGHWAASSRARTDKKAAKRMFDAVFPTPPAAGRVAGAVAIGSAAIERERLAGRLATEGMGARVCWPIRFRAAAPIAEDLRAWIEQPDGLPVVYVSFGSAVELDRRFALAVHEGLRNVRARVLWSLPAAHRRLLASAAPADAIRFETFVPQPEVLEHPAVRAFVTQGGPWSLQEAWIGGTPTLCLPFFADQGYNASIVEQLGIGRRLWPRKATAKAIADAIEDVLNNPAIIGAAKALQERLAAHDGAAEVAAIVEGALRAHRAS